MSTPAAKRVKPTPAKLGGTKHIGACRGDGSSGSGDIAQTVLLPGDPLRAKWIADNYLTDATQVTAVRNMLGFTGTYKGTRVTVLGSGMGMGGASIYYTELIRSYRCRNLLRIGSCGTVSTSRGVALGDVVLAQAAGTDSKMQRTRLLDHDHACVADFGLLRLAEETCREEAARGLKFHVGKVFTSDYFYHPQMETLYPLLKKYGYAGIEMECSALYGAASEYQSEFPCRVLGMCTVSDEIYLPEETADGKFGFKGMSAEERETSLSKMVHLALEVAIKADKLE